MNYVPAAPPDEPKRLPEYLARELARLAASVKDDSPTVLYRTLPATQESLSAGISANWKIAAGNVVRISTSATVTLTGIVLSEVLREIVLINVGHGVVVMNSEDAASSASYRFALPTTWQLSANASATLWLDPFSHRLRGIART